MAVEWNFEQVAGPYGHITEGPAWDGEMLLFTHTESNRILRYDPRTGETTDGGAASVEGEASRRSAE